MVYSSEPLFGKPGSALAFIVRRFIRIVPLYWLTTTLWILIQRPAFDARTLLESYFFIPFDASGLTIAPLFGVGWTLNFEMFFYAIFSAAIVFRRDVAVVCVTVILLFTLFATRISHTNITAFVFWGDPIVLEFIYGMMIAVAYRRGLRIPAWLGGILCVAGIIAIWHTMPFPPPMTKNRWLVTGAPAAMIFAGMILQPPFEFRIRWLAVLGDASYSIYLWQGMAIATIAQLWPYGLNHIPVEDAMIVGLLATLGLGILSFRYIEIPASKWLRNIAASSLNASPAVISAPPEIVVTESRMR
jgi:peptidoglycan/LPS O-acetylase OafA/YrhL